MEIKSIVDETSEEANVSGLSQDDLARAISMSPGAAVAWEALSPSHQSEYLRWISDAKKSATRAKRVAKTVEMMLGKTMRPYKDPKTRGQQDGSFSRRGLPLAGRQATGREPAPNPVQSHALLRTLRACCHLSKVGWIGTLEDGRPIELALARQFSRKPLRTGCGV